MNSALEGYQKVKPLGKGAFGQVNLVKDKHGKEFAVKEINKSMIIEQDLNEYLKGEIQCMLNLKSPNIVKLQRVLEDHENHYLVCEFCNSGTLMSYQMKQPNQVLPLDQAIKIIVDVLKGLQIVHQHGFMHRDIKVDNILAHKKGNQLIFKLADFGFTKKVQYANGTVLGTGPYMAPEIFSVNYKYDEEVDMWALAVTFYFMLNFCYPFQPSKNPHASLKDQKVQLMRQIKNFNYEKSVKNSRKKNMVNCTDEVKDFFQGVFCIEPEDRRITFDSLKHHPLFQAHFQQSSNIKNSIKKNKHPKDTSIIVKFQEEKKYIYLKLFNLLMLSEFINGIKSLNPHIPEKQMLALEYNVQKFKLMQLMHFDSEESIIKYFQKQSFSGKWQQFMETNQIQEIMIDCFNEIRRSQLALNQLYSKCKPFQTELKKQNKNFARYLTHQIKDRKISKEFRDSYLTSARIIYKKLLENLRKVKKHSVVIAITMVSIIHSYPLFLEADADSLQKAFPDFIKDTKSNPQRIDFRILNKWLRQTQTSKLKNTVNSIIKAFYRT